MYEPCFSGSWSLNVLSAAWHLHCCALGCRRKGQMWAVGEAGLKILFVAKETSGTICKARVLIVGTLCELSLFSPWVSYSLQLCWDYLLHTSTAHCIRKCMRPCQHHSLLASKEDTNPWLPRCDFICEIKSQRKLSHWRKRCYERGSHTYCFFLKSSVLTQEAAICQHPTGAPQHWWDGQALYPWSII